MRVLDLYLRLLSAVIFIAAVCMTEAVAAPGPTINVWCIGPPSTEVPGACLYPLIEQQAQRAGHAVAVENIRAADFVARFRQAVQENSAPEILMFNNFGVLIGVTTPAGRFEGLLEKDHTIAESLTMVYETLTPFQPRGWWTMLVASAANNDAAKKMALQPLPCPAQSGSSRLPQSELSNVSELGLQVARAYLVGDNASLAAASDPARLGNKTFLPGASVTLQKLQACGVYGNERLAFVTLAGTFLTKRPPPTRNIDYAGWLTSTPLGQQSLLAVFRKHQGQWRLMAITDDPINTGASGVPTIKALNELRGLLVETSTDSAIPQPARLLTPDRADLRKPPFAPYGTFLWQPSPDEDVVCEIAEFLVGDNPHPRERTRLFFLFGREGRVSAGMLWGRAGTWRVWSVSTAGTVSLSAAHFYRTH